MEWGELDYLLVDTPPGTTDEHLSVNTYMKESGVDGAVLVTTPQEVSLLDVRKELDFCRKAGIRVLGLVENMSGFVCPGCKVCVALSGGGGRVLIRAQGESQIFKPTTGGAKALAEEMGVPFLGAVPLDPRIGLACDYGESFFDAYPDSPACLELLAIIRRLREVMGLPPLEDYEEDE